MSAPNHSKSSIAGKVPVERPNSPSTGDEKSSSGLELSPSVHFCTLLPEQTSATGVMFFAVVSRGWMLEELLVLVIEDDLDIQALIDEALCDGGYQPALAASGEEAITLLRGRQTKYRVLVTDISLVGKIDGWEVARAAREIDPEFPVVYITGAAADQWPVKGVPNSVLLTKPFAPAQLVTAVSQLLNSGGPPPCEE